MFSLQRLTLINLNIYPCACANTHCSPAYFLPIFLFFGPSCRRPCLHTYTRTAKLHKKTRKEMPNLPVFRFECAGFFLIRDTTPGARRLERAGCPARRRAAKLLMAILGTY